MEKKENLRIGLTFDDVLLVPRRSDVLPSEVDLKTRLTKKLGLNIPLLSSPMDTVTEARLAIALAREGGVGIIHRNMSSASQCAEVAKVKKSESWIIRDPVTLAPKDPVGKAFDLTKEKGIASFPIISDGALVGILTHRDMRFKKDPGELIENLMTKELITVKGETTQEDAISIFDKHKIEKIPVVDKNNKLLGLITVQDIEKSRKYPNACKDSEGRLRVGAAVGPTDLDRVGELVKAEADVIVIDTAHGHSKNVLEAVKKIKSDFEIGIIAGNIATGQAAEDLIAAGADAVKIGIGPGSICTTRVVAGVGVPQITAIQNCAKAADAHDIPVIADGGVRYSGDIAKAIAAGASAVMAGSMFAGTEESPGDSVIVRGRKYKRYRGMGSLGAMVKGSKDRYFQGSVEERGKLVPEGVEGIVPYRGTVAENVYQLVGGVRSAMGYCGVKNIEEFRSKTEFLEVSAAGHKESHPHDVTITDEAPNYTTK